MSIATRYPCQFIDGRYLQANKKFDEDGHLRVETDAAHSVVYLDREQVRNLIVRLEEALEGRERPLKWVAVGGDDV